MPNFLKVIFLPNAALMRSPHLGLWVQAFPSLMLTYHAVLMALLVGTGIGVFEFLGSLEAFTTPDDRILQFATAVMAAACVLTAVHPFYSSRLKRVRPLSLNKGDYEKSRALAERSPDANRHRAHVQESGRQLCVLDLRKMELLDYARRNLTNAKSQKRMWALQDPGTFVQGYRAKVKNFLRTRLLCGVAGLTLGALAPACLHFLGNVPVGASLVAGIWICAVLWTGIAVELSISGHHVVKSKPIWHRALSTSALLEKVKATDGPGYQRLLIAKGQKGYVSVRDVENAEELDALYRSRSTRANA